MTGPFLIVQCDTCDTSETSGFRLPVLRKEALRPVKLNLDTVAYAEPVRTVDLKGLRSL